MELNFINSKVLIVGDVMLDTYWDGDCKRISPEAPVPVLKVNRNDTKLGGAANVANNIKNLGATPYLMGLSGNDDNHDLLVEKLTKNEIDHYLLQCDLKPTITKLRMISNNHQMLRVDFEESFSSVDKSDFVVKFESIVNDFDIVVISDYAKGTLYPITRELIKIANESNIQVLVDPKGTDYTIYEGSTYIKPNESEIKQIVGDFTDLSDLYKRAHVLRESLNIEALVITLGSKGMALVNESKEIYRIESLAKQVYDVTGAGDTVISILASALAKGMSIHDSLNIANIGAGIVVGKFGTSFVTTDELNMTISQ